MPTAAHSTCKSRRRQHTSWNFKSHNAWEFEGADHWKEVIPTYELPAEALNVSWRSELTVAINNSRRLLDLPSSADTDGPSRVDPRALTRATAFLAEYSRRLGVRFGRSPGVPSIDSGPDGSVDVHWKTDEIELLVNFAADTNVAEFYGDNRERMAIRGTINPSIENEGLIEWLVRL